MNTQEPETAPGTGRADLPPLNRATAQNSGTCIWSEHQSIASTFDASSNH